MLISSLMCRTDNKKMAYKDSGGSRGAGGPGSLSFVDPVEVRRAENKKNWKPPPPPITGCGNPPPPHPYLKVWTRNWKITFYYQSESHAASETNLLYTKYVPASEVWYDIRFGLFFFPSRLCLDALVHRCLSVGLTFQVLPGFTLNINHLYTQIFLVLSVTICHDQLVSGISNNEEFYTLACITGVIMRVLRRLLCDLSLEILSGHLKRCTHLIGFVLLL